MQYSRISFLVSIILYILTFVLDSYLLYPIVWVIYLTSVLAAIIGLINWSYLILKNKIPFIRKPKRIETIIPLLFIGIVIRLLRYIYFNFLEWSAFLYIILICAMLNARISWRNTATYSLLTDQKTMQSPELINEIGTFKYFGVSISDQPKDSRKNFIERINEPNILKTVAIGEKGICKIVIEYNVNASIPFAKIISIKKQ